MTDNQKSLIDNMRRDGYGYVKIAQSIGSNMKDIALSFPIGFIRNFQPSQFFKNVHYDDFGIY